MNGMITDPVCGMSVQPERAFSALHNAYTVYFCSEFCQRKFLEQPEKYFSTLFKPSYEEARESRRIAYFSMEVAVGSSMPTYAGGLGVLAGDMLKSCADLRVPIVGVTLASRKGYFEQTLDESGWQSEDASNWAPEFFLQPLNAAVQVEIENRIAHVQGWKSDIVGQGGYVVPLILLDTDVEGNTDEDRALTDRLYGGDDRYRLAQEIVLGIGGVRMLEAAGFGGIQKFHLNEGHAALLALELLRKQSEKQPGEWDFNEVRERCVFTTHRPVPAGHDQFGYDLVERVLGNAIPLDALRMLGGQERLNMTLLGLNLSRYVNGVAKRHEEVSREMFPGYPIHHITNGVHSWTWTCDSFRALFDRYIPGWNNDPALLRQAVSIPKNEIWAAHEAAKLQLLALIKERAGQTLAPDALTIGFARRATPYKRADLIFTDVNRLLEIARQAGPLQLVFAGKAHPRDHAGKELIQRIVSVAKQTREQIPIIYLENYDLALAKLIVSGVDLWLNTSQPPLEASGTSGMKAAHNGLPSFSVLDGWWIEGHLEGITGWSIGTRDHTQDADDLYRKLKDVITPFYYHHRERWIEVMRNAIALNASYFNTHRVAQQYVTNAYLT